jgi:hypothetical protein
VVTGTARTAIDRIESMLFVTMTHPNEFTLRRQFMLTKIRKIHFLTPKCNCVSILWTSCVTKRKRKMQLIFFAVVSIVVFYILKIETLPLL